MKTYIFISILILVGAGLTLAFIDKNNDIPTEIPMRNDTTGIVEQI